jgi:Uma2 family endonuclease
MMVHVAIIQKPITAEEFLGMYPEETNQPIELINGEVIVSPTPRPVHQSIVVRLSRFISNLVIPNDLGELQVAPSEVHFDEINTVQPDLFFVSKDNDHCKIGDAGWWEGAPDLCIEIISPSSTRYDRADKFNLYQKHGVREYWIVEPDAHLIEVYTLAGDAYQRVGAYVEGETFNSSILPDLSIPVTEVFPPKSSK